MLEGHLSKAEGDVAALARGLCGLEALRQLAGQAVQLALLADEAQQVLHDGPEVIGWEGRLRREAAQNVRQHIVDGIGGL